MLNILNHFKRNKNICKTHSLLTAILILINILSETDKLSSGNREFFEESRIKKSPKVNLLRACSYI